MAAPYIESGFLQTMHAGWDFIFLFTSKKRRTLQQVSRNVAWPVSRNVYIAYPFVFLICMNDMIKIISNFILCGQHQIN